MAHHEPLCSKGFWFSRAVYQGGRAHIVRTRESVCRRYAVAASRAPKARRSLTPRAVRVYYWAANAALPREAPLLHLLTRSVKPREHGTSSDPHDAEVMHCLLSLTRRKVDHSQVNPLVGALHEFEVGRSRKRAQRRARSTRRTLGRSRWLRPIDHL